MKEDFRAYRQYQKEQKKARRREAQAVFDGLGISWVTGNGGVHMRAVKEKKSIDLWPGTCYWKYCDGNRTFTGHGLMELIRRIGHCPMVGTCTRRDVKIW